MINMHADGAHTNHRKDIGAALELVGTRPCPAPLWHTQVHGTVCFTGVLSNQ